MRVVVRCGRSVDRYGFEESDRQPFRAGEGSKQASWQGLRGVLGQGGVSV